MCLIDTIWISNSRPKLTDLSTFVVILIRFNANRLNRLRVVARPICKWNAFIKWVLVCWIMLLNVPTDPFFSLLSSFEFTAIIIMLKLHSDKTRSKREFYFVICNTKYLLIAEWIPTVVIKQYLHNIIIKKQYNIIEITLDSFLDYETKVNLTNSLTTNQDVWQGVFNFILIFIYIFVNTTTSHLLEC